MPNRGHVCYLLNVVLQLLDRRTVRPGITLSSDLVPVTLSDRRSVVVLLCVSGVSVIGWLDYVTGVDARVFPFYYVFIAGAAARVSKRAGFFLAALCTILWSTAMGLGGVHWSSSMFAFNIIAQGASFALVAMLVGHLATKVDLERELSRRDNLTQLPNSRYFYEIAEVLMAGARRSQRPLTIAYVDLDNFKQVNDTQGHMVGDLVLKAVARVMRSATRNSDLIARLGGDEFAVLLPDTTADAARIGLGRLAENLALAMKAEKWPITASIGAISFAQLPSSVEDAVHLADELMYRVKIAGKNSLLVETVGVAAHSTAALGDVSA